MAGWLAAGLLALACAGATSARGAPVVVSGPPGGSVGQILVAPSDGRIAYATTAGNLFLTRDAGRHWRLVRGRFRATLTLFAVDPTRPSVLYATVAYPEVERLLVSRDSGLHWRPLGPFLSPGGLAIAPRHPRTLYVHGKWWIWRSADGGKRWRGLHLRGALALDRRGGVILNARGLYRSVDGGRRWRRVHRGIPFVASLLEDPGRPGTLYVLGGGGPSALPPFTRAGLYRTRDGGATWTRLAAAAGSTFFPSGEGVTFTSLVIDPEALSTLYATTKGPGSEGDHLLRSTDRGTSWRRADRGLPDRFPLFSTGVPLAIGAGRSAPLYVGTASPDGGAPAGVYTSTDGGRHWRPTGPGLVASPVVVAASAPSCPSRLYAATGLVSFPTEGSGLYASADGARTWGVPSAGPPSAHPQYGTAPFFTGLAVDAGRSAVAFAGGTGGVWRTEDGGHRWSRLESAPGSVGPLFSDPRRPGSVYAGPSSLSGFTLVPRVLMVTRDRGATWGASGLPLPGLNGMTAMAFDPRHAGVLYAATRAPSDDNPNLPPRVGDGVFASADAGATWTPVNAGLGDTHVGALALDPRHPATLYAATESHGLYRSADAGRTWRRVGRGPIPGPRRVNVLAVDPVTSRLYAANGQEAYGNGDWGLWRSADGGHSWSAVLPNILHAPVTGLAIDSPAPTWMRRPLGSAWCASRSGPGRRPRAAAEGRSTPPALKGA